MSKTPVFDSLAPFPEDLCDEQVEEAARVIVALRERGDFRLEGLVRHLKGQIARLATQALASGPMANATRDVPPHLAEVLAEVKRFHMGYDDAIGRALDVAGRAECAAGDARSDVVNGHHDEAREGLRAAAAWALIGLDALGKAPR